jgi:hypothetical protein
LRLLAATVEADTVRDIAKTIVPLIMLAEAFSWYAAITTNYLGNVLENSLWTAAFLLIAIALLDLVNRFRGAVQLAIAASAAGIAGYVVFMCTVDVPVASFGLAKHILPRYRASPHIRRPVLGALAVTARSPRPMQ